MYKHASDLSFRNALKNPDCKDYEEATLVWVQDAQLTIKDFERRFARLGPIEDDRGIYLVGKRVEKWLDNSYNENGLTLLPGEHRLSYIHTQCWT